MNTVKMDKILYKIRIMAGPHADAVTNTPEHWQGYVSVLRSYVDKLEQAVYEDTRPPETMNPHDRAAVERALAQVQRGEYATDAEVEIALKSI